MHKGEDKEDVKMERREDRESDQRIKNILDILKGMA